jgi:hypothetical protein
MDADPEIVLTHGEGISRQDDLPFPNIDARQTHSWTRQDLVREMCAVGANLVNTPTAIGRVHPYPTAPIWRCGCVSVRTAQLREIQAVQAIYRKHSSNMSNSYWNEDWSDYIHHKVAFDRFFEQYKNRLPGSRGLLTEAYRALAETAFWRAFGRMRRGHIGTGLQLLRFSSDLDPRLRFGPPAGFILRQASTKLLGRT